MNVLLNGKSISAFVPYENYTPIRAARTLRILEQCETIAVCGTDGVCGLIQAFIVSASGMVISTRSPG